MANYNYFGEIALYFLQFNVIFDHFVAFQHKNLSQGWIKATNSPKYIIDIVLQTYSASEVQEHCFCLIGGLIFQAT